MKLNRLRISVERQEGAWPPKQGLDIKIGLRCEDPMAVKAAVRQRMGVGLGFEDTIKAELDDGKFKIIAVRDLKLEGASYIVYSKRRPLSPIATTRG